MEFTNIQLTLTVVVLTAAALLVFFDFGRKRGQQPQQIRVRSTPQSQRSSVLFNSASLEYAPARKLAAERPLEPVVGKPTVSKPPAPPAAERETVTIRMNTPLPGSTRLPEVTIDAALWERLIASMPEHDLLTDGGDHSQPEREREKTIREKTFDVAPGALNANFQVIDSAPEFRWPTGMIQQPVFQKLLDNGEPFSGLVVSIGINDSDSSMWHGQGLLQSVGAYLTGLLKEKDFSCRTAYDEFVLVCRGEHGAQSQRRLNHISERLWDYQLRGMGACSILFSWGGVQVQDQPLAEAISSAVERMRQTKRTGSSTALKTHRTAV